MLIELCSFPGPWCSGLTSLLPLHIPQLLVAAENRCQLFFFSVANKLPFYTDLGTEYPSCTDLGDRVSELY